ncbi:MAG TPA: hypothetical protein VJ276_10700 [Thermoanaerobaculia bacterium]|nr:hypothetical protein [Thermoanaerobaculia bacterium]
MKRPLARLLLSVSIACIAIAAWGEERDIGVAFAIKPGHLYDKFNAQQNGMVVKLVIDAGVKTLNDAFPLFHFHEGAGTHNLDIELADDPDAPGGVVPAVYLLLRMDPRREPDLRPLKIVYRTATQRGLVLPEKMETFADELSGALRRGVVAQREVFVTKFLGRIDITNILWPSAAERAFALPFRVDEFGSGTRFAIFARKKAGAAFTFSAALGKTAPFVEAMPDALKDPTPRLWARAEESTPADGIAVLGTGADLIGEWVRLENYYRGSTNPPLRSASQFAKRKNP